MLVCGGGGMSAGMWGWGVCWYVGGCECWYVGGV